MSQLMHGGMSATMAMNNRVHVHKKVCLRIIAIRNNEGLISADKHQILLCGGGGIMC